MIDYLISNANYRFETLVIKILSDSFADISVKNKSGPDLIFFNFLIQNLDILDFHI